MQLKRLRLENFMRHRALELQLAPGLNIVRGANESGKTSIQRALEVGLFRRPTSSAQDIDEARPWGDAEADPAVEIEFEDDEGHGVLRKTFAGQRGTVELRLGDETLSDPAAVEAAIARLTGLPSEKFFRATASVHYHELDHLTEDESTLRDRLQQSMSGADRGTRAARRKLEDAIRRYRTEGAKNPGYLKVHRAEVDRLRERVRAGEAALEDLERDRRVLVEARTTRAALDERLAEQREGVRGAERAVELAEKQADAERRYGVYRRAAELRDEIAELEASHPSPVELSVLRSAAEHLRELEFRLSEMRAELAAEPDLSGYDVAIPTPMWRPWVLAGVALIASAAAALAGGMLMGQLLPGVALSVALAAAGGFALLNARRRRQRLNDVRMQNELRESEIARRLAGRSDLGERVRQLGRERADALASLGMPDLMTAERTLAAETEHVGQIGARRAEYRGLLGEDAAAHDVAALRDRAAAEADECRHALAGMAEVGPEPAKQLAAYRAAIQRLTPEREAAFHAEAQAEARLAANDVDAETVAADAEALRAAEESLAAAERRLRIYEDVLATLDRSEQATMKKAARFLEQRMARDIERITGGRYRRLKVDESTLTFMAWSPETNDWLDVRRLSQGTLDQLYLCARLGIVRQVTQPASPPLLFDDPFITFDDARARRALALLKDIAREHQVIFLTTSDRYDSQADHVVELPAPTERDEPEPVAAAGPVETLSVWSSSTLPEQLARPLTGNGHGRAQPPRPPARDQTPERQPEPVEAAPLWPAEER